ncbi:MAG TPA: ABC transporter substrate binding protein, partial [Trichococcus flocculiformis]|nr:ABC transporter substrate binding protein [Trichococcus flocculiformis]
IPVFPAADTMVKDGGVATFAPSQYGMGTQIGQIAIDILKGADPATYPVQLVKENSVYINQAKVDELGLTIPEDVKAFTHEVLRHRILLTFEALADGVTSDQ